MRKKHDFAKFVHKRLEWSLVDNSPEQSETVWLCTYVAGYRSLTSTNLHACDSHQRPSWRSHTPVCSDSVTRVTIFGVSYSTRVLLRKLVTGFESRFSQNDSTQVTVNDSRLESESFLQNFWVSGEQTQFVCTQRNEHFCFNDDQLWHKFSVSLSSRAMLHFKD